MSLSAAVIDALVASGATVEQLAAAVKADLSDQANIAARQIPWPQLRAMAFERDGKQCGYCGCEEGPFEVDHVVPRSKGGENVLENVRVACQSCNRAKKDRDQDEWGTLHERRMRDRDRKRIARSSKLVRGQRGQSEDKSDLPNEYISNPSGFDVSNETSAVSSFQDRVVEAWNAGIEGTPLPAARKLIGNRLKHLRCRVREHGEEAVFTAIGNMIASDWHSGRSGNWLEGNLGWLLKSQDNFEKMLERTSAQPPTSTPSNLSILSEQAQRYRRPEAA